MSITSKKYADNSKFSIKYSKNKRNSQKINILQYSENVLSQNGV
jgi:hypothetical protein